MVRRLCHLLAAVGFWLVPLGGFVPGLTMALPCPPAWAAPVSVAAASPHPSPGPVAREPTAPARDEARRWGNLLRFLAGGLLAGWLWSCLFGYPSSSFWPDEPFPLGLMDLTVAATLFYLGLFLLNRRAVEERGSPRPRFLKPSLRPLSLQVEEGAKAGLAAISARDPGFSLSAFGDQVQRLIVELHDAWNHQNLERLGSRLTQKLMDFLRLGLEIMSLRGEISRLEDLNLHRMVVVEAGRRGEGEFISVWLEGEVLDYVLKGRDYRLVSGSLAYPAKLRECWLFRREGPGRDWQLQDIVDY